MKHKTRIHYLIIILCLLVIPSTYARDEKQKPLRPIEIPDILEWKNIRSATLSNNGRWFAYKLSPNEGDSKVIVQSLLDTTRYTFNAGSPGGRVAFSDDSRWVAFGVSPGFKESKRLKKQKKKIYNNVAVVDLSTGKKQDFKKIRRFAFCPKNPRWLALHKYIPENQGKEKNKWKGSDLLLLDLETGAPLNIGNVSEFAFNKTGEYLAWTIDAVGGSGNGVLLRNLHSSVIYVLDSDTAEYSRLEWTEKGDALSVLKGITDEKYEDKLHSVLGFYRFNKNGARRVLYDPREDAEFPPGMTISPNRTPTWSEDLSALFFGIHELKEKKDHKPKSGKKQEKKKKPGNQEEKDRKTGVKTGRSQDEETLPDMVIWHWKDKRLQPMQQVQQNRDKKFSYLSLYRVQEKKFIRLADDTIRNVIAVPKQRWAIGYDDHLYLLQGNLDGRRYRDIYIFDLKTGARKLALKKCRWSFSPAPDGKHFLYYQDGDYYTYEMATGRKRNITRAVSTSFINKEDDHNVVNPPIRPFGWSADSRFVLLFDNWDVWKVGVHGDRGVNLTGDGRARQIRYRRRFRLDPEEKGIDLKKPIYLRAYGEWSKKGGIARVRVKKPGAQLLLWDDAIFSTLMKAKDADVFLYTRQTDREFPNYFVSDGGLQNGRQVTDANPQQKDFLWSSGVRLIEYTSKTGKKLQAALFLPANYQPGKSYPTIVYIYEKLSQNLHRYFTPSARGFNKSVYTSHGYAVLMPDITYQVNDPGMSAVWCVLPAVEAAVQTGIVDRERIGIHGHSWGGYQTAFLITQTDLFKAAVAGAPLTNMISMYSSVYWNTGSANQPIFESSQGRFKGGYWENLEAYTRNSPVYFARNVKTPLIILHNDKDGAVDWNQGIEYFNTLRRLGKEVVMLQYKGENHGLRKPENQKDYTLRMKEFFDHFLQGKQAPKWWLEGVPLLKLKDHLKERQKLLRRTVSTAPDTGKEKSGE